MTIVETAMERAREMASGLTPSGPLIAPNLVQRVMAPVAPISSVMQVAPRQPTIQIKPHALSVDHDACRENRLVLNSREEDAGAATAYRMLRTRLLHRIRAQNWVTIGVTSSGPAEGKTLTTLNLAASLARENNSDVVVLDLDMRNPSICKTLGVKPQRELREYFAKGDGDFSSLFFSIGVEKLMIAGHSTPTDMASELLASNRFEELVGHIRQGTTNPIILIDLPPVLSTDDALVIAPRIDALLLVVSEGQTDRSNLQKAADLLSEFPIAGMVLNRSVDDAGAYQYGYGPYGVRT